MLQKLAIACISLDRLDLINVSLHHFDVVHCWKLLLFPLLRRLIDYIRGNVGTLLAKVVLLRLSNRLEIGNGWQSSLTTFVLISPIFNLNVFLIYFLALGVQSTIGCHKVVWPKVFLHVAAFVPCTLNDLLHRLLLSCLWWTRDLVQLVFHVARELLLRTASASYLCQIHWISREIWWRHSPLTVFVLQKRNHYIRAVSLQNVTCQVLVVLHLLLELPLRTNRLVNDICDSVFLSLYGIDIWTQDMLAILSTGSLGQRVGRVHDMMLF